MLRVQPPRHPSAASRSGGHQSARDGNTVALQAFRHASLRRAGLRRPAAPTRPDQSSRMLHKIRRRGVQEEDGLALIELRVGNMVSRVESRYDRNW